MVPTAGNATRGAGESRFLRSIPINRWDLLILHDSLCRYCCRFNLHRLNPTSTMFHRQPGRKRERAVEMGPGPAALQPRQLGLGSKKGCPLAGGNDDEAQPLMEWLVSEEAELLRARLCAAGADAGAANRLDDPASLPSNPMSSPDGSPPSSAVSTPGSSPTKPAPPPRAPTPNMAMRKLTPTGARASQTPLPSPLLTCACMCRPPCKRQAQMMTLCSSLCRPVGWVAWWRFVTAAQTRHSQCQQCHQPSTKGR